MPQWLPDEGLTALSKKCENLIFIACWWCEGGTAASHLDTAAFALIGHSLPLSSHLLMAF